MSGFLDRMAARAGGAAADVAPRVPALFESAAVTTPPKGLAALEAGPLPVRLPPAAPSTLPVASPPPLEPLAAPPWTSAAELGQGAPPASAGMASAEPDVSAAEVRPEGPDPAPARVRVERELGPVPVGGEPPTPVTPLIRPAALVVPAVPVAIATAAPAGAVPGSSAPSQRGPDVIRVSIGRVDVRAPAAPPRPAPKPAPVPAAKADRLSLQEYLRGQRGAR